MRIFKNKKASLELSIRTIVVVVLAMTLLGLGLGFIQGMFKDITAISTDVSEQVRQQILDDLRTQNKRLSFPSSEVKVSSNGETIISIGVMNTLDQDINFLIMLLDEYGVDVSRGTEDNEFYWDNTEQFLEPGQAKVYGIKYFAPVTKGTTLYKIKIGLTQLGGGPLPAGMSDEFDSKGFFVRVI